MSRLCLLSEPVCAKLNVTEDSAGCRSAPNQNHANAEQGGTKKNTKSHSPSYFLQTQDVPLGKHRQQNRKPRCRETDM